MAISSSAISPTSVTFRQNARFAHVDVTLSTLYRHRLYPTEIAATATSGARQLPTRTALPIRAISTASSNTVSIPAFSGTLTLFGLDLKNYTHRRLARIFAFGTTLAQRVESGLYGFGDIARFNGAPYQDTTLTQKQARHLYSGPDQTRPLHAGVERPQRLGMRPAKATNRHRRRGQSREDSKFSGRAGLIYNFD